MVRNIKIVLLEDALFMAPMLGKIFSGTEIQVVETADNCAELLYQIETLEPDIVLTDLVLPEHNGIEAIQQVRAKFPVIPIIAYSGLTDEHTVLQALRAGADDFIAKPFHSEKLLEIVYNVLSPAEPQEVM